MGGANDRSEHGAADDDRHPHKHRHAAGPEGRSVGRAGILIAHDAGWGWRVCHAKLIARSCVAQKSPPQRFSAGLNRECHRGLQPPSVRHAATAHAIGGRLKGLGWGWAIPASQIRSVPRLLASCVRGPGPC
jgi:hypothetical protein